MNEKPVNEKKLGPAAIPAPNLQPGGATRRRFLGGLSLGVVETLGAAYISVPYKDAFAFLMLLTFLMVRPQGLFGERIAEKA